jgi:hypothetical protein
MGIGFLSGEENPNLRIFRGMHTSSVPMGPVGGLACVCDVLNFFHLR